MNTNLQIPIDKQLRDKAKKAAEQQGFSSLQEIVRVFISKLAHNNVEVGFEMPTVKLSAKNSKRYDKILDDIESGKVNNPKFTSVDKLFEYLDS